MNNFDQGPATDQSFDADIDPIELLSTFDLADDVIDIVARFGAEGPETALIDHIFRFDGDFELIWQTQFRTDPESQLDDAKQATLKFGLLQLFAGRFAWSLEADFATYEHAFMRWQHITRNLLRLDDDRKTPWLYGWARLGVELCYQVRDPRLVVWDDRLARAASSCPHDAELGKVFADELPLSLDDILALEGLGPATVRRTEVALIEMLLHPEQYAPTLDEMFGGAG